MMAVGPETQIRRLLLALLTFGLVAVLAELVALGHYEEFRQLIPLVTIGAALAVIGWHVWSGSAASLRVFRGMMVVMLLVGMTGVVLHMRGSLEFQLDANPDLSGWPLVYKILHAKAPPALAPGIMVQLGLLGLIYGYKNAGRDR